MLQYALFCIWFSFHDTIFAWLIHVFACTLYLFYSFWAVILLSVFGFLRLVLLWIHHLSAYMQTIVLVIRLKLLGYRLYMHSFRRNGQTSKVIVAISTISSIWVLHLPHILTRICNDNLLNCRRVQWDIIVFIIFISPLTNDVQHIFTFQTSHTSFGSICSRILSTFWCVWFGHLWNVNDH